MMSGGMRGGERGGERGGAGMDWMGWWWDKWGRGLRGMV